MIKPKELLLRPLTPRRFLLLENGEVEGEDTAPSNLLNLSIASNDNYALIEFIGHKTYKYIFENPS